MVVLNCFLCNYLRAFLIKRKEDKSERTKFPLGFSVVINLSSVLKVSKHLEVCSFSEHLIKQAYNKKDFYIKMFGCTHFLCHLFSNYIFVHYKYPLLSVSSIFRLKWGLFIHLSGALSSF